MWCKTVLVKHNNSNADHDCFNYLSTMLCFLYLKNNEFNQRKENPKWGSFLYIKSTDMKHCFYRYIILLLKKDKKKLRRDKPCNMKRPRAQRFLRKKKRASNITEASYRRYSNKKISTTFTLAGVLAASWQISYFLRRDCILRKREGRFSTLLFASPPYYIKLI